MLQFLRNMFGNYTTILITSDEQELSNAVHQLIKHNIYQFKVSVGTHRELVCSKNKNVMKLHVPTSKYDSAKYVLESILKK
jgi:hypothetical protein